MDKIDKDTLTDDPRSDYDLLLGEVIQGDYDLLYLDTFLGELLTSQV
jgi:hypothetical protein